jgi:hypothetical protein
MSDFVIINGKRYRKPKPAIRTREDRERLFDQEMNLHEKLHNVASALSEIDIYGRDQRYTCAIPQVIFEMLERTDEGAAIVASTAFLEAHGYRVSDEEDL